MGDLRLPSIDEEAKTLAKYKNSVNGLTKLLMVILRIAIGWHLCYEGCTKLQSHWEQVKPFSAEMYLRNSTGPLSPKFREIVQDFHGVERLDAEKVQTKWKAMIAETSKYYNFDSDQKTETEKEQLRLAAELKKYLSEHAKEIEDYKSAVSEWERNGSRPMAEFELQEHRQRQIKLYAKQMELVGPVDALTDRLQEGMTQRLTDGQRAMPAPVKPWEQWTELERVDAITMYGLTICGGLMMLGLFSRLSCLGAACLLALFYISYPPWPGLPEPPNVEGTYLYVNKNLIEMIACLMLATSPSGIWGGLDAVIRGMFTRPLFGVGAQEIREAHGQSGR